MLRLSQKGTLSKMFYYRFIVHSYSVNNRTLFLHAKRISAAVNRCINVIVYLEQDICYAGSIFDSDKAYIYARAICCKFDMESVTALDMDGNKKMGIIDVVD